MLSSAVAAVAAAVLVAGVVTPAGAVNNEVMTATDPGPAGSFPWKGFNWQKRFWLGAPHYNRAVDPANVTNPDASGFVTLKITNPTGKAPIGAEFLSTRKGFGYGTYSVTVEKNLAAMQKEVVWGCLFTYDPAAAPGYNEIDLCEASAWGGGAAYGESWPVSAGHGYWFDATKPPGQGNNTVTFGATADPILTHRMVWEPRRIIFETFAGAGYTGKLLKRTVLEGSTVPVPAKEAIHFNLWVTGGGGGNPATVKPETVTLRDFSFTPLAQTKISIPKITLQPILHASTPTLNGAAIVGQTVAAKPGRWTAGTSLRYQWYKSGAAIRGATSRSYKVRPSDRNAALAVRVTGTKAGHKSVAKTSTPIRVTAKRTR
jgi:hypothetical protein